VRAMRRPNIPERNIQMELNGLSAQTSDHRGLKDLKLAAIYGHVTKYGHNRGFLERESERILEGPRVPCSHRGNKTGRSTCERIAVNSSLRVWNSSQRGLPTFPAVAWDAG
jgi:hypothetical protein